MAGTPEVPNENSIFLWPDEPPAQGDSDFRPWLDAYPLEDTESPRPAVLICPGGGYGGRAKHEGIDVAKAYNERGFPAFVCHYRVTPNYHPAPLFDVARAIRIIRSRAAEFGVAPTKITVLGFSAGGHLAATLSTLYREATPPNPDEIDALPARPDASILCYAVLTSSCWMHVGSYKNLLGPDATDAQRDALSLDKRIDAETPPAFIWSTADDPGVPVENSLLYAMKLREHGVDFAMHVFPNGPHGVGLAPTYPDIRRWHALSCDWIRQTLDG